MVMYQQDALLFCRFDKVPLVTPNGDVLVKELNFEVIMSHQNTLSVLMLL